MAPNVELSPKQLFADLEAIAHVRDVFAIEDRNYPLLSWTKIRLNGQPALIMSSFSIAYGDEIVGPDFAEYLGKTDMEFWQDKQAVAGFLAGDRAAIVAGHVLCGPEEGMNREKYQNKIDGHWYDFVGEKWAVIYLGTVFVRGRGRGVLIDGGPNGVGGKTPSVS